MQQPTRFLPLLSKHAITNTVTFTFSSCRWQENAPSNPSKPHYEKIGQWWEIIKNLKENEIFIIDNTQTKPGFVAWSLTLGRCSPELLQVCNMRLYTLNLPCDPWVCLVNPCLQRVKCSEVRDTGLFRPLC